MTGKNQAGPTTAKQLHPAVVAMEFLGRAGLEGREVQVYVDTYNWLNEIVEGRLLVITPEDYAAALARAPEDHEEAPQPE